VADGILSGFSQLRDVTETSPSTPEYNCIAWAAEDPDRWWWPANPEEFFTSYWPEGSNRDDSVDCFVEAFSTHLGYQRCESDALEPSLQKVGIYVNSSGRVTHMARQLESGRWTSKLGSSIDIEHGSLAELGGYDGHEYGKVAQVMSRPKQIIPTVE
jgi:hypothetical protein